MEEHTLSFLLEREFPLLIVVFVLSPTPVFASLYSRTFESARGSAPAAEPLRGRRKRVTNLSLVLRHNETSKAFDLVLRVLFEISGAVEKTRGDLG